MSDRLRVDDDALDLLAVEPGDDVALFPIDVAIIKRAAERAIALVVDALLAVLLLRGPCTINELTTVAAAFSMARSASRLAESR